MSDPMIGAAVGDYRIVRLIGAGGMGRIYEARHPGIAARVALKIVAEEGAPPELTERLFAEARAVNQIHHEGIVNVVNMLRLADGRPCIVMEYLDGETLLDKLQVHGPQPLGAACQWVQEVLDALGAAHAHGIIHRDVKPDNIFVVRSGHTKLLDFGIAKFTMEASLALTATGAVVGTTPYMSPEQVSFGALDGRSDIFSAGVLLYALCTGKRPFTGKNIKQLMSEHRAGPRPASELRPDLPESIELVIETAMSLDPDQRFATAAAMAYELEVVMKSLPRESFADLPERPQRRPPAQSSATVATARARPATRPTPATRTTSGKRWAAAGLCVALVVAGVSIAASLSDDDSRSPGAEVVEPSASVIRPPGIPVTRGQPSSRMKLDDGSFAQPFHQREFDPMAALPAARALARELEPDATMTMVAATIAKDGRLPPDGAVTFVFTSPTTKRCASVVINTATKIVFAGPASGCWSDNAEPTPCTAATLVAKLGPRWAPVTEMAISYQSSLWSVVSVAGGARPLSALFDKQCQPRMVPGQ